MGDFMSRRGFLASSGAGALCAGLAGASDPGNAHGQQDSETPFWEQYHSGALGILRGLADTQVPVIEREMATAYDRIQKGGTLYSQITSGHFPTSETALDRTGNPGVFAFLERGAKEDVYAGLKPEDMILTNTINLNNIEARRRGIRVVAVTINYYPFTGTPPGEGYQIEYGGRILKLEDTADITIDSQTPWYNGLVKTRHAEFPILPGGGFANVTVYWMAAAEMVLLQAHEGKKPSPGGARRYIDRCIERALMAGQDRPKYRAVGERLADLVLDGAAWYVYSDNPALTLDAWGVANGPMITKPLKYGNTDNIGKVREGDIVLIGAYSSANPNDIAVARECRNKGAYVVALTPFTTDGDASGERLYKEVDVAFDTFSPESGGVISAGAPGGVCPTTGVIGDLAMWLLIADWTDVMRERGEFPYFWKGFFMNGGREYNDRVRPLFDKRGW